MAATVATTTTETKRPHKRKRSDKKKKEKKDKKKQKRSSKRDTEAEFQRQIAAEVAAGENARRSSIPVWTTTAAASTSRVAFSQQHQQQHQQQVSYYADSRGDPGNVAFGKMYRSDIPLYRRADPTRYIAAVLRGDGDAHDNSAWKSSSSNNIGIDSKKRKARKIQIWRRPASSSVAPLFSSSEYMLLHPLGENGRGDGDLVVNPVDGGEIVHNEEAVNTFEQHDHVLEKTREFNVATRERPQDLQLWLDYAAFQEEAMCGLTSGGQQQHHRRGGAVRATAEKQISILERGLEHHPGSTELLIALLGCASKICDDEEMERRWQRVLSLSHFAGSPLLWEAYVERRQSQFAAFRVSEVVSAHFQALTALRKEQIRLQSSSDGDKREKLAKVERYIAQLVVETARFRFQTGHTEAGVAAVRALLEFNWFAPEGWPMDALELMFEETWGNSEASMMMMIGDEGALGWGAWVNGEGGGAGDAHSAGRGAVEREEESEEKGGWVEVEKVPREEEIKIIASPSFSDSKSAWKELAPAIRARFGHALRAEDEKREEEIEEDEDEDEDDVAAMDKEDRESEEELLARLGMDLEAALADVGCADADEELTPSVLSSWLEIEQQRDAQQWEPQREHSMKNDLEEEDGNLLRFVAWEDIAPCVVAVSDPRAREILLFGCLHLLGVSVPPSTTTTLACLHNGADEITTAASWLGIDGGFGGGGYFSSSTTSGGGNARNEGNDDVDDGDDDLWRWLHTGSESVRVLPWWAAASSRQAFTLRCLQQLLFSSSSSPSLLHEYEYEIATALLHVASWSWPDSSSQPPCSSSSLSTKDKESNDEKVPRRDFAAGRVFAKHLLEQHRDKMPLWAAFARLEVAAGRVKAAKKIYAACLAGGFASKTEILKSPGVPQLAIGLAQLGTHANDSSSTSGGGSGLYPFSVVCVLRASPAVLSTAFRPLLWLGSSGQVPLSPPSTTTTLNQNEIVLARRGFQEALLCVLRVGGVRVNGLTPVSAAVVTAAAAMELLLSGVSAALAVYSQVLDALLPPVEEKGAAMNQFNQLNSLNGYFVVMEQLEVERCALAVDAAMHAVPAVSPALARTLLSSALRRFPGSAPLLRVLRSLEFSTHAMTALRRSLHSHILSTASSMACVMVVVTLLGVEIETRAPKTAIRSVLQRAVAESSSCHRCPLLWRLFLRFEQTFGSKEAVHKVFLRAIEACPGSKGLWMDGLVFLNGTSSAKETSEFLIIMRCVFFSFFIVCGFSIL